MEIGAFKYQNNNRSIYFRGFIKKYKGHLLMIQTCKNVWKTKKEALQDAKKLCLKI